MSCARTGPSGSGRPRRIAGPGELVVTLALLTVLALFLAAWSVSGASATGLPATGSASFNEELEEEFEPEEECLESEAEFEELCEEGEAEESGGPYPPEECVLETASARLTTFDSRDRVRLAIRYRLAAPARVTIDYRLSGGKGPLKLGRAKRHLSRIGLLVLGEKLSRQRMAKVRAAGRFLVEIHVVGTPSYCHRYSRRHLTIRRVAHSQAVWLQSDSIFGTA
jgi:hypothetical protein